MKNWGEKLEEKITMLPDSPGCYLMKDAGGKIIYNKIKAEQSGQDPNDDNVIDL